MYRYILLKSVFVYSYLVRVDEGERGWVGEGEGEGRLVRGVG
jgi:hypothetical protein